MFRSWSNRLFGGVCGGLSESTPLSAFGWRALMIVLAVLSQGWAGVGYVGLWWWLPLRSPITPRPIGFLTRVIALAWVALVAGGYLLQSTLIAPNGMPLYPLLVAFALALLFTIRQWATRKQRGNVLWGLVALVVIVLAGLQAFDVLPVGIADLLARSVGALGVFGGLSWLLRDRITAGNWVALLLSVGLTAGIAVMAFSSRTDTLRNDNQQTDRFTVGAEVTSLQINLETLDTDVQVFSAISGTREITAQFTGSDGSTLKVTYEEAGAVATFTFIEAQRDAFPLLEALGRGTLRLEVPQELGVFIAFRGQNGTVNFDVKALSLEWLNLDLASGSAVVSFPTYAPLSADERTRLGELRVMNGDLRLVLESNLGAQFIINRATNQRPLFDDLLYALEDNINEWRLTSRQFSTLPAQIRYILTVPRGQIRLNIPENTGG